MNTEISFHDRGRKTARYVSATTVREEALESTRFIGLYWSASGQVQMENVTSTLPGLDPIAYRLQAFDLMIDGQELHNNWEWASASERPGERPGTREAVVELRHRVRPVSVKVVTRLDGTPFLLRYLEITNTGNAPAALSSVSPWSGMIWTSSPWDNHLGLLSGDAESAFTLGYYDGVAQGTEGNFVWETLPRGVRRVEGMNGRSGFGGPYFIVRNELTGECALGALGWSGNWYAEFWNDPHLNLENYPGKGCKLAFRMGPAGPAPLRVIAPGETVISPEMHLAVMHSDLDSCVQAMHQHLRASVIPPRPAGKEMFTIAGRIVEEKGDWILKEIDIAAEMGVEAFIVDANWYGREFINWRANRGDWEEGNWITGGLAACRERAHRHGMLFGLWMEPEQVGPQSRLREEHPDWFLSTDDGRHVGMKLDPELYGYNQWDLTLDLANPQAAAYVSDWIVKVIRDHKLDFFKLDYNINVFEGGRHMRDGFAEHEAWRHFETIYGAFDRVRREFPDVALENCASGGARNDLGMMSRFHYASASDYSMFPRSIRAINGWTLFLPPETLCYYHNLQWPAHHMADLDTHLRVCLFAQTTFVGFGGQNADRSTEHFRKTRRYIELAKEFTEPILGAHPRVFHHTPDIGLQSPADWCVLEYAATDASAGYAGIFRLGRSQSDEYLFKPRGLDPNKLYMVTMDNAGHTIERQGMDLMHFGIPVRLDGMYTSELLMFREKEQRSINYLK